MGYFFIVKIETVFLDKTEVYFNNKQNDNNTKIWMQSGNAQ
jgi:hypothetical protein